MASPFTLKKKQHFLQRTPRVPREKMLFCPIEVSKHVQRTLVHDMDCQPLSDFLTVSASRPGWEVLLPRLQAIVQVQQSPLVLMGMEPTAVYDENLRQNLHGRLYGSDQLHGEFAMVDPGAVAHNRTQYSLPCQKNDDIDCAAECVNENETP